MPTGSATRTAKASSTTKRPEKLEKSLVPSDLQTRIARRAYQLYENGGRVPGRDLENWLQAEQELLSDQMDADFG